MRKRKGFTIIELVIVIAVIGVLAAVLLPGFRHAVDRANAVNPKAAARAALMEFLAGDRQQAFARDKARPVYLEVTGGDCFLYSQEKLDGCDGVPQPGAEAKTVFLRSPLETGFDPETDALTVWRDGDTAYVRYPAGAFGEDTAITTTVGETQEFYELTRFAGDWALVDHWEAAEGEYRGYPKQTGETAPLPAAVLEKAAMGEMIPPAAAPAPVSTPNFLDGQTRLNQASFAGYTSLTTVTIPASVMSISEAAFVNLNNLVSFEVDADSPRFKTIDGVLYSKDGTRLVAYPQGKPGDDYVIPDGVTDVSAYAFTSSQIKTVSLPDSVTLSSAAFIQSKCLAEFMVSPGNQHYKTVDGVLFSKDGKTLVSYPIGKAGKEYVVPEGVTIIGAYAFYACALTGVSLPDGLEAIREKAFNSARSLSALELPDSVSILETATLHGCSQLKELRLSKSLSQFGTSALLNTPAMCSLTLPEENTHFLLEGKVLFNADKTQLLYAVPTLAGEYSIPDTVTYIAPGAFFSCKSLEAVTIPEGVQKLYDNTFGHCVKLAHIDLPDSLECIDKYTFTNCSALTMLSLPRALKSIGVYSFSGCASLSEVRYSGTLAEWSTIRIDTDNDPLLNAALTCEGE